MTISCFLKIDRQLITLAFLRALHDLSTDLTNAIGNIPFLKQLFAKISANDGAMIARNPYSPSAHGACSRDDPQPKFLPATRIDAP